MAPNSTGAGKTAHERFADTLTIGSWRELEHELAAFLGMKVGHAWISAAIAFYSGHLGAEFQGGKRMRRAFQELLGIFYREPVRMAWLQKDQELDTWTMSPVSDPGPFLAQKGTPPQRLGVWPHRRYHVRLRVAVATPALESIASGLVDNWSDPVTLPGGAISGVHHPVNGGGRQFRVPRSRVASLVRISGPTLYR